MGERKGGPKKDKRGERNDQPENSQSSNNQPSNSVQVVVLVFTQEDNLPSRESP